MNKTLLALLALVLWAGSSRAQTVPNYKGATILGWRIGESFADWKANPHLAGKTSACDQKKVDKHFRS